MDGRTGCHHDYRTAWQKRSNRNNRGNACRTRPGNNSAQDCESPANKRSPKTLSDRILSDRSIFHTSDIRSHLVVNFVCAMTDESRLRPFVLVGARVTNLAPDRSHINSITRFAWVFGGGVKHSFSKHL